MKTGTVNDDDDDDDDGDDDVVLVELVLLLLVRFCIGSSVKVMRRVISASISKVV